MSLEISKTLTLYFWFILFVGCKESVQPKQFTPDLLMKQVLLFSDVYHSPVCSLGLYKYPILVYRYSGNMCHSSIIENLMELQDFQGKIGKDNILVLPAFPEDRGGKARLNKNHHIVNSQKIKSIIVVL